MDLGYARVSTNQDPERQFDARTGAGIPTEHVYTDEKAGTTTDLPRLLEVL